MNTMVKTTRICFFTMLVLASVWVDAGINSTNTTSLPVFGNYQAKGFLTDYSNISPAGGDSKAFIYRNHGVDLTKYKKIMLDPIKISTKRDAWPRKNSPIFGDLAEYFSQAIVHAVGDSYIVVNTPGPDVLRLRIAVTDLEPNDPGISIITLVVPFLWLGEASAGAAQGDVGSTPFAGQAVVEMEALDSVTNTQITAYIERRVGKKYTWEEGVSSGLSSYMKGFFTWAYTEDAFDHWANLLRSELTHEASIARNTP